MIRRLFCWWSRSKGVSYHTCMRASNPNRPGEISSSAGRKSGVKAARCLQGELSYVVNISRRKYRATRFTSTTPTAKPSADRAVSGNPSLLSAASRQKYCDIYMSFKNKKTHENAVTALRLVDRKQELLCKGRVPRSFPDYQNRLGVVTKKELADRVSSFRAGFLFYFLPSYQLFFSLAGIRAKFLLGSRDRNCSNAITPMVEPVVGCCLRCSACTRTVGGLVFGNVLLLFFVCARPLRRKQTASTDKSF